MEAAVVVDAAGDGGRRQGRHSMYPEHRTFFSSPSVVAFCGEHGVRVMTDLKVPGELFSSPAGQE
jgi:hypothetical protein